MSKSRKKAPQQFTNSKANGLDCRSAEEAYNRLLAICKFNFLPYMLIECNAGFSRNCKHSLKATELLQFKLCETSMAYADI